MSPNQFRRLALSMPEAVESEHMGHADFRVNKRVFATLGYPDERYGMLKLTGEGQIDCMDEEPGVFSPAAGAWGARGCTLVRLKGATAAMLREPMRQAWGNVAPKRLRERVEGD